MQRSYHRPALLSAPSFPFTRKCLGIAIASFAVSLVSLQYVGMERELLTVSIIAQIFAWIFLILTLRGLFEVLSGK